MAAVRAALLASMLLAIPLAACGDDGGDAGTADLYQAPPDLVPARRTLSFAEGRTFAAGMPIARPGFPTMQPLATGDFDGDHVIDLAVPATQAVALAVLLGDGKGGFTPVPGIPMKGRPSAVVA